MPAPSAKPVTVTLGALTERAAARVRSGDYASMSEVLRAGLRALDREDERHDALLKAMVDEAMANPQLMSFEDASAELWQRAAARRAARSE